MERVKQKEKGLEIADRYTNLEKIRDFRDN